MSIWEFIGWGAGVSLVIILFSTAVGFVVASFQQFRKKK